ncbi:MAG: SCP2 sterol-binding domain-containing protein [Proteobacteria bacterium]|nr:SCP2 sterol-binding domain-containing protein [Pseudomonadota bacterium]MBS0553174.1 SCP2 sterol-binding domain-containing protein [Pseudomonadota bacterium]
MIDNLFLSATNHLLAQSGWARKRLAPHAGRTARLELQPLGSIDFSVSGDGHLAQWTSEEAPDVLLRVPVGQLPQALGEGMEAVMREVRIEGNAEFADALGFVFRHLRWDLEEDLSRVVGDIAAHRLVETGRQLTEQGRRALASAGGNVAEYLVEEQPLLVSRHALPGFAAEVAELRDAVARMDKRIARLVRR